MGQFWRGGATPPCPLVDLFGSSTQTPGDFARVRKVTMNLAKIGSAPVGRGEQAQQHPDLRQARGAQRVATLPAVIGRADQVGLGQPPKVRTDRRAGQVVRRREGDNPSRPGREPEEPGLPAHGNGRRNSSRRPYATVKQTRSTIRLKQSSTLTSPNRSGNVWANLQPGRGASVAARHYRKCYSCGGSGVRFFRDCSTCNGMGIVRRSSFGALGWLLVLIVAVAVVAPHLGRGESTERTPTTSSYQVVGPAVSGSEVEGVWRGWYVCAQGITGLDLALHVTSSNTLTAEFYFYPLSRNPAVPSGRYSMTGYISGRQISLTPVSWIQRPSGFYMVGVTANVQARPDRLRGKIPSSGCGDLAVDKV